MNYKQLNAQTYSLARLLERCRGKCDRECLYRLCKEAAIIAQDFESALLLRVFEKANKPAPRRRA